MGGAEGRETFEVEHDVAEGEDSGGVIKEGHGCGFGTLVVVAWGSEEALLGAKVKLVREGAKDGFQKDKAGEEGA
jgi:hypothetical protein